MKTLKKLTLGLLAAGALTGSASAAFTQPTSVTIVHVAGSTAFRAATAIAIIDTLQGKSSPTTSATTDVYAGYITSGKNVTNDSEEIFANGHIDGVTAPLATVIVETNWTGSLTGVVDLVSGKSATGGSATTFLDENDGTTQTALNATGAKIAKGTYVGGVQITGYTPKATGDSIQLAMSDSNKATIQKELATATLSGSLGGYGTISALAVAAGSLPVDAGSSTAGTGAAGAGTVGVVPFQWFLDSGTGQTFSPTGITQQQADELITNGYIPQAVFTGTVTNTGDTSTTFFLVGRNEDSGTRIGALAESGFGVANSPVQFIVGDDSSSAAGSWSVTTAGGTTATGSGVNPFPAGAIINFEPQLSWGSAGHSGYNAGGNVQAALNITTDGTTIPNYGDAAVTPIDGNTTSAYFIGYLGLSDGNTAISGPSAGFATGTGPATGLKYNGVPFTNTAVANGEYTFWTFEHAYRLTTMAGNYSSGQSACVNSIADNLYYRDADAIYSSGAVTYAETIRNSGTYKESTTAGKSPGNAGLLFDHGFTATRAGLEGSAVISIF